MDDRTDALNLDLLTMPSERQFDDSEFNDSDDGIEDEEYVFNFDPGPLLQEYAQSHIEHEKEIFGRLSAALNTENFDATLLAVWNELYEETDGFAMYSFGIGGLVLGLASFGCVPIKGDTGGIAADVFPLMNPWVRFYVPVEKVSVLLMAAQNAGVSLKNGDGGSVDAYCDDVRKFNLMAEYLCNHLKTEK